MTGYVDIHTHIIPGVDDGSQSMEQSIKMAEIMNEQGITAAIATPHYYPGGRNTSPTELQSQFELLQNNLMKAGNPLKLHLGNEIYYRSSVSELLETHLAKTLTGSFYVLVEFNPGEEYSYIRNAAYQLLSNGYIPILAHVERYRHLTLHMDRVEEVRDMGACIQVNAAGITGDMGREIKKAAHQMLKQELVHFVATDTHDTEKRAPLLQKAAAVISKKYGEDYMTDLLYRNPMKVINKEEI